MDDIEIPDDIVEIPEAPAPSNRGDIYVCSECKRSVGKENLRTKRISFLTVGKGGRAVRTRNVAYLCLVPAEDGGPSCLERDPAWSSEKYVNAPGFIDTKLAKT